MKRNIFILLILVSVLIIFSTLIFASETIKAKDYIKGKFPLIFNLYLSSLEDLDLDEKVLIDLLEKLPEEEQKYYAKEVYKNGFSQDLLDNLKHWQINEEGPSLKVAYPRRSKQQIGGSPLFVFGTTDPSPAVEVTVNDKEVEKFDFRTGNFLTLVEVPEEREFSIVVTASRGGKQTSIERTVIYPPHLWKEMPQNPLAIHANYSQPKQDQVLRKGDQLKVIIQGSPEAEAVFQIGDRSNEVAMQKVSDLPSPLKGQGIYLGSYTVQAEDVPFWGETLPQIITVTLRRGDKEVSRELTGRVRFASSLLSRIVEVTGNRVWLWQVKENSFILSSTKGGDGLPTQGVGYYILPGTRLEVIGKAGDYLRVKLGAENYLIHQEEVREMGYAIKKPFTGLSKVDLSETKSEVKIRFNTRERIPFLIEDKNQQLRLILFGVRSSDYIVKRGTVPLVQKIEIESLVRERADAAAVTIELDQPIAGFDYQWEGTELVISLRKPPEISEVNPLQGRTIVIDPGHGGESSGAVGPGDIHERDVVLEIGKFLQGMLEDKGAEVIMTRTQDVDVNLSERIDSALEHHADLFISIHANAHAEGADAVNYHGHMTLYNYAYNQKLAEIMLDNLVERMGLPRKIVWQRNDLTVLRRPQVPSVLVETAFMMHPEDNWYLLQPEYQREFARAIMDGIIDYFLSLQGKVL